MPYIKSEEVDFLTSILDDHAMDLSVPEYVKMALILFRLHKKQRENNKRTAEYIAERRKTDPKYARPKN